MPPPRLSFKALATIAVRQAFTHPSHWLPALFLLVPAFVLQLAGPTYLRTRLAPSPWTVVAGAVLLVWLTQVALPALCAIVHARRAGIVRPLDWPLLRLSVIIGTRVTLGLAAAVLPGLWLQARDAFVPLSSWAGHNRPAKSGLANATDTRAAHSRLLLVASLVLLMSMLGQSAIAALAEVMGTITPVGQMDGPTLFQLNFLPHALTTLGAYVWNAATLTLYALCVSQLFDEARGMAPVVAPAHSDRRASVFVRAGQIAAGIVALSALIAAIYKVQQHLN